MKVLIVVALVATFVLMCCMRMSSICSREEERKEWEDGNWEKAD